MQKLAAAKTTDFLAEIYDTETFCIFRHFFARLFVTGRGARHVASISVSLSRRGQYSADIV